MKRNKKKSTQNKVSFWGTVLPLMAEYKLGILFAVFCSILVGIAIAVQPLIIQYIVDEGIDAFLEGNTPYKQAVRVIAIACILYAALGIARILVWRWGLFYMLRGLENSLFALRAKFFSHVNRLCMRFYDSNTAGEIFNYLMGSPMGNIKNYLHQAIMQVPYQAVSLAISLAALLNYNYKLTVILCVVVVAMVLLKQLSKKKIIARTKEYLQVERETSSYVTDVLHGMDAVKLYSIEDNINTAFEDRMTEMKDKGVKYNYAISFENAKPEMVQYLGTAMVYLVGGIFCLQGEITVGILYAFLSSMGTILTTLLTWLNLSLTKSSADVALEKIVGIINEKTTTPEVDGGRQFQVEIERSSAIRNRKPCIELSNVSFSYDGKKNIFENLSLQIPYRQSVAIVGSSGSGKSTVTKLMMRLYEVQEGAVLVHGRDVRAFGLHDLRLSFGIVPQAPFIFHDTIWNNVRVSRPDASNYEIIHAMEIAHVHEFVNELSEGWNTMVGDGALGLSGGQKQRIAIARAILKDPDILIFDEATSALDNISERHIQGAMEELMKTHTVIIIAHRLSTIQNVDRILVFDDGKIVQDGNYATLSETQGLFRELLTGEKAKAEQVGEFVSA